MKHIDKIAVVAYVILVLVSSAVVVWSKNRRTMNLIASLVLISSCAAYAGWSLYELLH